MQSASTGQNGPFSTPSLGLVFCFWHSHPMSPGEPQLHSVQSRALKEAWDVLWAQASGIPSRGGEWGIPQGHPGSQAEWPQLSPSWKPAVTVPWQLLNTSPLTLFCYCPLEDSLYCKLRNTVQVMLCWENHPSQTPES